MITSVGSEELSNARMADRYGRRIEVLVTVKATPQPSRTYGDTVCVAGVVVSPGPARWVRLYPVPFRYLDGERQFAKYSILDVAVRDAKADKRSESLRIDADSLTIREVVRGWPKRAELVEAVVGPTMCEVLEMVRSDMNAISLAAVRPREVMGLEFEKHPGWTSDELARFQEWESKGDLLAAAPKRLLAAPRLKAKLSYFCETRTCNGHTQRNIDWELTALQSKLWLDDDDALKAKITENFLTQMFAKDRSPLIYVGNQENPRRRSAFTVLGVYYPKTAEIPAIPLF